MSVTTNTSKVQYTLSSAVQALPITFYFLDNSHIKAIRARAGVADYTMVLGTDYSLIGAGDEAGGTLTTIATNLQAGDKITIKRDIPITQLTNYVYNDKFPAEVHEKVADKLTMEVQQLKEVTDRAVQFPESEVAGTGNVMPVAAERAAKILGFDASGNGMQLYDPASATFVEGDAIYTTSIAALKAISVTGMDDGQQAHVAGYSAAGDGGGGRYFYDLASTAADDNDFIIQPAVGVGRWRRIHTAGVTGKRTDTAQEINVVAEGDSLTAGGYPAILAAMSYCASRATVTNVSTSGHVMTQVAADYATQVAPFAPNTTGKPAWLLLWIGSNDAAGLGNPTTWETNWVNYITQARADGFKLCVFTIMRRLDLAEKNDWIRLAMNKAIRKRVDLYDTLIDMADLVDPSTADSPFYHDSVHLNTIGYTYVATLVNYSLQNPTFGQAVEMGNVRPVRKTVINGGTNGTALVITEVVGGIAHTAYYRPSGVATEFYGTRFYYDASSNLIVQTSNSAEIGAHTWTDRLKLDNQGNLVVTNIVEYTAGYRLSVGGLTDMVRTIYDAAARAKQEFYKWAGSGVLFWGHRIGCNANGRLVIECAAAAAAIGSHTWAEWVEIDGFNGTFAIKKPLLLSSYIQGDAIAAPAAPAASKGRSFFRLNGGGKMEFCVIFPTGAVQVVATEP